MANQFSSAAGITCQFSAEQGTDLFWPQCLDVDTENYSKGSLKWKKLKSVCKVG